MQVLTFKRGRDNVIKIPDMTEFRFEKQVPVKSLEEPVWVGVFNSDGLFAYANKAGINFAAVDYEPPIIILIEKSDLRKAQRASLIA